MNWTEPLYLDFWVPILVATLCGFILGMERQYRGKPAGIRTSVLICVGSCLYISLGRSIDSVHADPSRILSQLVVGVGFLGGGVILSKDGLINGVTSAAIIWLLAAVGAAVGLQHYGAGIAVSVLAVTVLVGVEVLERGFLVLRRGVHSHNFNPQRRHNYHNHNIETNHEHHHHPESAKE